MPTTDGPVRRPAGGRLADLDAMIGAALDSVDETGKGAAPLTPRELAEEYGIGMPHPHPRGITLRGRRAAPGAGSAIIGRMTAAENWGDGSEGGQTD